MFPFMVRLERLARTLPFRVIVALAITALQVAAMAHLGRTRLSMAFNASPEDPPSFHPGREDGPVEHWDRLIVSRWDAEHYIGLGLRGYKFCKDKADLKPGEWPDSGRGCQLHFYPGYSFLGSAVRAATHLPIDYALFGVSLASCVALILMWTSRPITDALGVGGAYLSLLLLSTFSGAYILVTIETEPALMAFSMGAFMCVHKRWWLAGAFLAGAASAIRITGVGAGFAFCVALLVVTLREHPRPSPAWARSLALMVLAGWGAMALMGYFWVRFGDVLAYQHSYQREYHHGGNVGMLLAPDGRLMMQSIWAEPYDGVILAAGLLWFALGHRAGLRRFAIEEQAYWYTLFVVIVLLSMIGSVDNAFAGMHRYIFTALPLFFAMAGAMRRKPAAVALWVLFSTMHLYNAGACFFESQRMGDRSQRCGFSRSFRSAELFEGKP